MRKQLALVLWREASCARDKFCSTWLLKTWGHKLIWRSKGFKNILEHVLLRERLISTEFKKEQGSQPNFPHLWDFLPSLPRHFNRALQTDQWKVIFRERRGLLTGDAVFRKPGIFGLIFVNERQSIVHYQDNEHYLPFSGDESFHRMTSTV